MRGHRCLVLTLTAALLVGACGRGAASDGRPRVAPDTREGTTPTMTTATTIATAPTAVPDVSPPNEPAGVITVPDPGPVEPAPPETAPPPTVDNRTPLERAVGDFVDDQAVPFHVVAVDLRTGTGAYHLADRPVLSASLYKLFVARELLRRVYAGSLDRSAPMGDSEGRTIDECIRAMIVVSDNDCGVTGLGLVGRGALDDDLAADGYGLTSLASPQRTSASDVARFLLAARGGTLLGPGGEAASAELYGLLGAQAVNDRFPLGLPPGTPVAHKTGDRLHWAHDAGIVSGPNGEFLLVALTGPWDLPCCDADKPGPAEAVAFGAIADLARTVYATLG